MWIIVMTQVNANADGKQDAVRALHRLNLLIIHSWQCILTDPSILGYPFNLSHVCITWQCPHVTHSQCR